MERWKLGLAVASALWIGCGDDGGGSTTDVAGLYEVTYHTVNEDACDAEGAANTDYSHFQLVADNLLGQPYVSFGECTSADTADCTDGGLFTAFIKTGGELVNELSASSGGGTATCYLSYARGVLTEPAPGSVRIVRHAYSDEDDTLTEEECDPDTASARGETMPCVKYEVIEGTLVP